MTKIYKKPTHTNRYLNFNSAHSRSQKQGLVKCLLKRAQSQLNSKRAYKTSETSKIMKALKKNDYPKRFLKRTVRSLITKTNLSLADKKEIKTRVVLPYVPRYFEALSKILRNVGILVSSKPHLTLKDMLPKAKDSVERSSRPGVVYQIPCRDCTGIYIGETGRAYKTRLAEHKRDLKPANLAKVDDNNFNKKTALVKHVITKDHPLHSLVPDPQNLRPQRLKSRHPFYRHAAEHHNCDQDIIEAWNKEWTKHQRPKQLTITPDTTAPPESDLPPKLWVILNRLRA